MSSPTRSPDQVDADHRAVGTPDQLHEALRHQDLALAVAAEVVGQRLDRVVAVRRPGGGLGRVRPRRPRGGCRSRAGCRSRRSARGRGRRCPRPRRCPAGSRDGPAAGRARCRRRRRRRRGWCGRRSSVSTKPRSMATPCSSYPRPSVTGPRPTATSSSSASITSPPSTVTATPSSVVLSALERRAGTDGDLALAERALQSLGGRLVLGGDQSGECLDDRDLGAEAGPHARELAADHAAAEHHHRRRAPGRGAVRARR